MKQIIFVSLLLRPTVYVQTASFVFDMATIHSKYIQRYQLPNPNYTNNILNEHVNDPRILEISDHWNDDDDNNASLVRVKSDSVKKVLTELIESVNLFFVIIKFESKHFDKTICESIVRDVCDILMTGGRYFLIEICLGVNKIVRYILSGEGKLEELSNEKLTDFFGAVDNSLLLSHANSSAFQNLKLVPSMPLPLHCILIRLLRVCDLHCPEDIEKSILENFASCSNIDCLRAFLDLPQTDDGESIKHTPLTTRAVHYKYRTGITLLFIAASGTVGMVKLLLRLGADVYAENLFSETASDHTKGNSENLLVLLENDAKFPRNFDQAIPAESNCSAHFSHRVHEIYEERQALHAAIVDRNEKFIDSFEKKYPNLKCAYTFTGEASVSRAATTTALIEASKNNDYATYLYLISKGFCVNDNELYFMTEADKNKVGAIILNRLKIEQQSHVTFLGGKTFVSGVDVNRLQEYKKKMVTIYERLNSFSQLASILKVVEHSKSLTVSVDFRNKNVLNLDLNASNTMDGLTYHNLGRIYLSVDGKDDMEIGGLIIHELTHFALHIIFNNHGYPYHKFDTDKERKFKEIVDKVKESRNGLPQVVNDVYLAYSESSMPKELIARVPQLISMESSTYDEMDELFEFYQVNVLPYMERLTRNPEDFFIRREVNQLNEFLRYHEEIEKWKIDLETTYLHQELYDGQGVKKVTCNIPRLFLTDFYNVVVKRGLIWTPSDGADTLNLSDKYIIFASIEDIVNSSTWVYVQRVWNLTSNITLLLDVEQFDDLESTVETNFLKQLKSGAISDNLIVFGPDRRSVDSIFTKQNQYFTLNYTWQHLTKCYRDALLSREINFQGAMVSLNELIDDDFDSVPMKKLIYDEEITINGPVDDYDEKTFVERKVKHFYGECATSEIVSLTSIPVTSFLLSGCPGSGLTTVMCRMARLLKDTNPHFWIARVNAEQLATAFEGATEAKHFPKHFLSTTSVSDWGFESSLFERLYRKSQVIFLFDSFVDLSDDCVERAVSFMKMLSERDQLWVTVHANSPATTKLADELSNKIVLELQPFSQSDHSSCIIKIWQNELRFDATNENVFGSYATKLIYHYRHFIQFPNLTATIARKYLICVNEHITRYSDEPFIPGNIYTEDGIIDIYDLHKDLYSEKIHRRHQQDTTNESAETVILGMNMFTSFEQFANYRLEKSDIRMTPLAMWKNGAEDLLRNGILDHHNLSLSGIGTGCHFFLSNYIVKSMESSFKLYGRLCTAISLRQSANNYRLIKLIDGRMKDSMLFCGVIDYGSSSFAQKYDIDYPKLKWDDVMYLVDEDAILLLCSILGFPSTPLMECFSECSLFSRASEKGLRCVIDILWNISHAKFSDYLTEPDEFGCNPFQYALMNFPRSDVDVVRDITTVFELSEALRMRETFQETLNLPSDEKYRKSTLNFFVDKILTTKSDGERNTLIYQDCPPPSTDKEYQISGKHFDDSIEWKWMAMTQLKFPTSDWTKLTTETVFKNVIHIVFNRFNDHVVTKFYRWAETKTRENVAAFKAFVADTFVNYFWNCTRHGADIVNFVRNEIDLEEVLIQRGIKIFNKEFGSKIAMYRTIFTRTEFEIILFRKPTDDDKLITKICSCSHDDTIYQTFSAIPLERIIEQVGVNVYLIHAMLWFMVGTLAELQDEILIKFIVEFIDQQERELISDALGMTTSEGSFFNLAFTKRDMFMVKLVWKMARSYLNEEEFGWLLTDPYNVYPKLVGHQTTNEFMEQSPSIHNSNCHTACFEFLPFQLGGELLPKFAISLNDKNQIFIGRCKVLNADGYFLCKIVLNRSDAIEVIGFRWMQPLEESLELLLGKGLLWTKHTDDGDGQFYFQFKQKLLKRYKDNVQLVDEAALGQYYLAYDDLVARETEILNGFCYYQGRSIV